MTVSASYTTYHGSSERPRHVGVKMDILAGSLTFDSSYPLGGEDISAIVDTASGGKFRDWQGMTIEPVSGYSFHTDVTNKKVKVYAKAPAIVYDEPHTIASNAITLNYPAAAILNMASATATQLVSEQDATLAANGVKLSAAMAYDTRPSFTFHASTSGVIYTTYITQAWNEVWVNRHEGADLTRVVHVAHFGETACFIESALPLATATPITTRPLWLRGGDAAATLEAEVDFTDSAGTPANSTTLTFVSTDAMTSCTATYITLPSSGFLYERFLEDFDCTMSSGVSAASCPARPILFQSLCGQIPDYTAANERDSQSFQMAYGDALGTSNEFYIKYQTVPGTGITGHIMAADTTSDALSLTYVYGTPDEIPGLRDLEVPSTSDLSSVTANFYAWGSR